MKTKAIADVPKPRMDQLGQMVGAFESETSALFEEIALPAAHRSVLVIAAMVGLSLSLSAVVKLDRVVTGTGKVISSAGQLYVSPLDRAIVREVLVKVGDVVKKGQPLAKLDSTFTAADEDQLRQHLASDQAEVDRRQAEIAGKPYTPAVVNQYTALQLSIWTQRQAQYRSDLSDLDARIASARASAHQYQQDIENYTQRQQLASKNEDANLFLQKRGYVTNQAAMASTDSRVEIGRLLADSQNQRDATLHTLDSLIAQRASYIEKWHSDATTDLVTVKNDLDTTQGSLTKAAKLNELTSLDAPADAIVLQIAKASRGSIADTSTSTTDPNSDALFTLVPVDVPLEVEMHIASEDVGFVEKGQTVRIKFDAYSYVRHGMATGTVKNLSEGSFTLDPDVGNTPVPAYFKARIALNDVKLHDVPADFRLIPGMTISADIIAGHRTILSYLVEGTLRTGSEAMREPE